MDDLTVEEWLARRLEHEWFMMQHYACHEFLFGIPCGPPYIDLHGLDVQS